MDALKKVIESTMGFLVDEIIRIIVGRLVEKGIDLEKIPACIETMINVLFLCPVLSYQKLNQSMQLLGWHNFEIDEHTVKLVELVYQNSEAEPVKRPS